MCSLFWGTVCGISRQYIRPSKLSEMELAKTLRKEKAKPMSGVGTSSSNNDSLLFPWVKESGADNLSLNGQWTSWRMVSLESSVSLLLVGQVFSTSLASVKGIPWRWPMHSHRPRTPDFMVPFHKHWSGQGEKTLHESSSQPGCFVSLCGSVFLWELTWDLQICMLCVHYHESAQAPLSKTILFVIFRSFSWDTGNMQHRWSRKLLRSKLWEYLRQVPFSRGNRVFQGPGMAACLWVQELASKVGEVWMRRRVGHETGNGSTWIIFMCGEPPEALKHRRGMILRFPRVTSCCSEIVNWGQEWGKSGQEWRCVREWWIHDCLTAIQDKMGDNEWREQTLVTFGGLLLYRRTEELGGSWRRV